MYLSRLKRKFLLHQQSLTKKNPFESHRNVQANMQVDLNKKILNCRLYEMKCTCHTKTSHTRAHATQNEKLMKSVFTRDEPTNHARNWVTGKPIFKHVIVITNLFFTTIQFNNILFLIGNFYVNYLQ